MTRRRWVGACAAIGAGLGIIGFATAVQAGEPSLADQVQIFNQDGARIPDDGVVAQLEKTDDGVCRADEPFGVAPVSDEDYRVRLRIHEDCSVTAHVIEDGEVPPQAPAGASVTIVPGVTP